MKWFLENAPEYKALLKKVHRWDVSPHRWGRDTGIDFTGLALSAGHHRINGRLGPFIDAYGNGVGVFGLVGHLDWNLVACWRIGVRVAAGLSLETGEFGRAAMAGVYVRNPYVKLGLDALVARTDSQNVPKPDFSHAFGTIVTPAPSPVPSCSSAARAVVAVNPSTTGARPWSRSPRATLALARWPPTYGAQ